MNYLIPQEVLRQRLAKKVRDVRKSLGLTMKAASARTGMHWRHWQKVEAATVNVTLLTLVRLGDALNIDPRELIAA